MITISTVFITVVFTFLFIVSALSFARNITMTKQQEIELPPHFVYFPQTDTIVPLPEREYPFQEEAEAQEEVSDMYTVLNPEGLSLACPRYFEVAE